MNRMLLSGWRSLPKKFAKENQALFLKGGYKLLRQLERKNKETEFVSTEAMELVLQKRWQWICECCGLENDTRYCRTWKEISQIEEYPVISVILPIYNSAKYLAESIESVIAQKNPNWELLAINEFGSNDGSAEIIQEYQRKDPRIKSIQNTVKLGLAESLNEGFRRAAGKYLARLDADDLAHSERFQKQVEFLEANPNVGICGTYQHHFGPETDWLHCPPSNPLLVKASLLFNCNICHSTLMLSKQKVMEHALFYNNQFLAEDFELWTRAIAVTNIANLPEVLGEYRWGKDNITLAKKEQLNLESGKIVAAALERTLGFSLTEQQMIYFKNWKNPFDAAVNRQERIEWLDDFEHILRKIYNKNQKVKFFEETSFLSVLATKWRWAKYNEPWDCFPKIEELNQIFDENDRPSFFRRLQGFCAHNKTFASKCRKSIKFLLRPIWRPIRKRLQGLLAEQMRILHGDIDGRIWQAEEHITANLDSRIQQVEQQITETLDSRIWQAEHQITGTFDSRIWQAEQQIIGTLDNRIWQAENIITGNVDGRICKSEIRINNKLDTITRIAIEDSYQKQKVCYNVREKIRIVFLFQVPSFWMSLESLYQAVSNDTRFEVAIFCYDEDIDPTIKTDGCRAYLKYNGYSFVNWDEQHIEDINPHVVVLQTPYDSNRRGKFKSQTLKQKGIRVVYIPYGIEISDTDSARKDHFFNQVLQNSWAYYTFSPAMYRDYKKYSLWGESVRALGIPKFDSLYFKDKFHTLPKVLEAARGRKIVLWKVHFPKIVKQEGEMVCVTPNLDEYIQFAMLLKEYTNLFFVFMPHPRFLEFNKEEQIVEKLTQLLNIIETTDNIYIDKNDDYRNSLYNSDFIIVDRSAIIVEAGGVEVPVLYMRNKDYCEPVPQAIQPLIDSYYQGVSCEDMIAFVEACERGEDPRKAQRTAAFRQCIPYFDGLCGERIKEDIVNGMLMEAQG